jgi:anti-sigma regulatory factor (Ser/Thr protein kinase)
MDTSAGSGADTGAGPAGTAAADRPRRVVHEIAHDLVGPGDLRGLRTELVAWVRATAGCPAGPGLTDRLEDVAGALYEALTNVVDHAYPAGTGPLRVVARLTTPDGPDPASPADPWLDLEVVDRGGWRPAPADPGHRGRGLLLLSRLADGHEVQRGRDGTHVRLWWHRPP